MADVTRRMLDLLAALQTGRAFGGADLARRLSVSPRTLRRDVERLREYGYPVETRTGPDGYYRLRPGTAVPPLIFDDEEAVATLVGLALARSGGAGADGDVGADPDGNTGGDTGAGSTIAAAADRAFGKLDHLLPTRLRPRAQAVRASLEAVPLPGPPVDAGVLAVVGAACARHERIGFAYTAADGTESARRVEPYRQVLMQRRWYLLGWDLDRADWRTFRLDRVREPSPSGRLFAPRPLPAESAYAYLRAEMTAPRHRVVLTVEAAADRVADRFKYDERAVVEPLGERRCRVVTRVDSFEWLVLVVGLLDADFVVEEPRVFAERCRTTGERLKRAGSRA